MTEAVTFTVHGRVGLATVDHPPVNALSQSVRAALVAALDRLANDRELHALVIVCAGKTFFSGADIKEFGKALLPPFLGDVIERLESSPKPTIAAIHGKALGGGLEVAMGCHYRIAVPTAKIGLPEVKLGLIPGAGGTQRLPRLVGVPTAIRVIAEGAELSAREALEQGRIDELVEGDLASGAIAFAERVLASGGAVRRTSRSSRRRRIPRNWWTPARHSRARCVVSWRRRRRSMPSSSCTRSRRGTPCTKNMRSACDSCHRRSPGRCVMSLRPSVSSAACGSR
jgi:3-hydroxyacyl-CoA dehydrogenase